jgi:hypothetical protein
MHGRSSTSPDGLGEQMHGETLRSRATAAERRQGLPVQRLPPSSRGPQRPQNREAGAGTAARSRRRAQRRRVPHRAQRADRALPPRRARALPPPRGRRARARAPQRPDRAERAVRGSSPRPGAASAPPRHPLRPGRTECPYLRESHELGQEKTGCHPKRDDTPARMPAHYRDHEPRKSVTQHGGRPPLRAKRAVVPRAIADGGRRLQRDVSAGTKWVQTRANQVGFDRSSGLTAKAKTAVASMRSMRWR